MLPGRTASIALLSLLAAGCASSEADPQIVVGLTTDLAVGFDLDRVEATTKVDGVAGPLRSFSYGNGTLSLPAEMLVEAGQDGAEVEIAVTGFRDGEPAAVVIQRAATRAALGRRLFLPVSLDEACSAVACQPNATCVKGACVDPFIAPSALADYDSRWIASAPDACKGPSSGASAVEIGKGESAFAPLDEGEVVAIEAGPQGGYHVWLALRVNGLRQQGSRLTVKGDFPDPAYTLPPFTSQITLRKATEGQCEIHGVRFQVDRGISVDAVRGQALDIEVVLEDPDGDSATAKKHVVIAP